MVKRLALFSKKALQVAMAWFLTESIFVLISSIVFPGADQAENQSAGYTIFSIISLSVPILVAITVAKGYHKRFLHLRRHTAPPEPYEAVIEQNAQHLKSQTVLSESGTDIQGNTTPWAPEILYRGAVGQNPQITKAQYAQALNRITPENVTAAELWKIDTMDGHAFEYWTADLLKELGFTQVEVTKGSGDQGVDVLAQKDGIKYAVQCKCYSSNLGNKPVQEVHSGKAIYHCHVGAVITNQYFTASAKELAEATGVLLWDRDWIAAALQGGPTTEGKSAQSDNAISRLHRDNDAAFLAAVNVALEAGQASTALLQRRLVLGYAQAASILEKMERQGIIGPFQGSEIRPVLISKESWALGQAKYNAYAHSQRP